MMTSMNIDERDMSTSDDSGQDLTTSAPKSRRIRRSFAQQEQQSLSNDNESIISTSVASIESTEQNPCGCNILTTTQTPDQQKPSLDIARQKQKQQQHDADSELEDALAASAALVGENILDSPQTAKMFTLRDHSMLGGSGTSQFETYNNNTELPIAPSISRNPQPPLSTDNANAMSVGIMAQGLAWARRQKERRQRQYLQHQAEQQLRKIRKAKAEEQQKAENNNEDQSKSLFENSTFRNLMRIAKRKSVDSNDANSSCDKNSHDTEDEVNNDNIAESGSGDDLNVTKKVSKSGDGYSVQIDLNSEHDNNEEDDESWIPPVRVDEDDDEDRTDCPYILTSDEMQQIAIHVLPRGIVYCKWKRCYSLARDGDSFDNCLRNIQNEKNTLLVVRTTRNEIFGGFADEPWEPHLHGGACYYGGPTACLFRFIPVTAEDNNSSNTKTSTNENTSINNDNNKNTNSSSTPLQDETTTEKVQRKTKIKCYHWTGANRYVQICDPRHKMLAFGGGGDNGAFGLCVQQDFQVGSSGPCATFNNEPLCDQDHFNIVDMEIYGYLVGQF